MESNNKNYNRRNTTLQKYNKDHLSTTLRKRKPIPSYKSIDLTPFIALHLIISESILITLILNFRKGK